MAEPFLRDDPEQGLPSNGHLPQVETTLVVRMMMMLTMKRRGVITQYKDFLKE